MTDIVFRIVGDAGNTDQIFGRVDKAMAGLQQRQGTAAKGFADFNKSSALTRQEMMALNYTASDVAASLASGASPWTVLLQQGGQVKDAFGGVEPLFNKLASVFTVARFSAGLLAAGLGGVAVAAFEGWRESQRLERALALTGNAAGLTQAKFDATAKSIAEYTGSSIRASRQALMAVVESGQFTGGLLQQAATAVVDLARISGQSADEIMKDFASMTSGVTRWAEVHNKSYRYLTAEQYLHIRSLESLGKVQEAASFNLQVFTRHIESQTKALTPFGLLIRDVKDSLLGVVDAMANIGRSDTVGTLIDRMRSDIARTQSELKAARARGAGQSEIDALESAVKRLNGWLAANVAAGRRSATDQAKATADESEKIARLSQAALDASIAYERSAYGRRAQYAELARDKERIALEQQYRDFTISAGVYLDRRQEMDRQSLAAREAVIDAELAMERRRIPSDSNERQAHEARLLDIDARRVAVLKERLQLEDRSRDRRNAELPDRGDNLNSARSLFLRYEREQSAASERYILDREREAQEFGANLLATNRQMTVDLISDDRARGAAQIDLDEETMRRRLDLASISAAGRQQVEEQLGSWRAMREQQLTEQLKPEWKRQLESYRDTNRLMKESFDTTMERLNSTAEDAWVEMNRSGKINIKALVSIFNDELSRVGWRKYMAEPASNMFASLIGAVTGGLFGGLSIDTAGVGITSGNMGLGDFGLGGGRANGGSVRSGRMYEVNEAGPELLSVGGRDFLMMGGRDGAVTPNWQLPQQGRSGGGGVVHQSVTYQVSAGVSPALLAAALAENNAALKSQMRAEMARPGTAMRRFARDA